MVRKKKTKLVVLLLQMVIAKCYVYLMALQFSQRKIKLDLDLYFINECNSKDKFIIFSDSMSVLQALNHTSSRNPQIQKLITISKTSHHLRNKNNYLFLGSQSYTWLVPKVPLHIHFILNA